MSLTMHHFLEYINQDIKKENPKAKLRTQQYMKLNTGAKEIQQVNPGGPDNSHCIRPLPSHQKISLLVGTFQVTYDVAEYFYSHNCKKDLKASSLFQVLL